MYYILLQIIHYLLFLLLINELIEMYDVITLNVYTLINLNIILSWKIQLGQLTLRTQKFSLK